MNILRFVAPVVILCAAAAMLPACAHDSYQSERPDPSSITRGDSGIQSGDIIGITNQLAPTVLGIPEIAQNPNKITVVVVPMTNATQTERGQNIDILNQRLAGNLAQHATQHIAFMAQRAVTENLQQTEGARNTDIFEEGSRNGVQQPTRIPPQYALQGTLYDRPNNTTTYYYIQFKLTNIATGQEVWNGSYDLKVKN